MHRHPELSLRTPDQISANRSKGFCAKNVDKFFDNLSQVLDDGEYEPRQIWNMDETACPTVPNKPVKVVAKKGARRVGQKTSAERGSNVTMALAINASGQSIPPFYIFPKKNMQRMFLDNASPGSDGFASESGWMTSIAFRNFMNHFVLHSHASKENPTLLVFDGHSSHLSVEALDIALANGITLLSLPPHCSHRMQPLDVGVFGNFTKVFNNQCQAWMKNHIGRVIEIQHVPKIADDALDVACTPRTIKSSFKASGIYPFDRYIFTEADFVAADVCGENVGIEDNDDPEHGRLIIINASDIDAGAHEEITTSEASTSMAALSAAGSSISMAASSTADSSGITPASLQRALIEVGSLRFEGHKKKIEPRP